MDWEYFFKYGFNPALKSLQDYQNFVRDSHLSRQGHRQRMGETAQTYALRGQEMEKEYGYRKQEAFRDEQIRKSLMDYDAAIERSLTMDKEKYHRERLQFENDLQKELKNLTFKNQAAITNLQGQYGLLRAQTYANALKNKGTVDSASAYNPSLPDEINEANFSMLRSGIDRITQEIMQDEQEMDAIQKDPGFQQVHRKTFSEKGMSSLDSDTLGAYKEKIDQLNNLETLVRERRKRRVSMENEYIKYLTGFKEGNPIQMQEEDVQRLNQIGFPVPVQKQPPKSQIGMDGHLGLIQKLVYTGTDLPPADILIEKGFDPLWLQANWLQYREFFRNRNGQMTGMIQNSFHGLSKVAESIGKSLGMLF